MKAILISLILTLGLAKCTKDKSLPCRDSVYSFAINVTLQNAKENYQVGDTIRIISQFPTQINNSMPGGQTVDYSNAITPNCGFGCLFLDSVNRNFQSAIADFSFIANKGRVLDTLGFTTQKYFVYQEKNGEYIFDVSLILKKKGRYSLVVSDGGSIGIRGKNCTNADFAMTISNPNKNLQIFTNTSLPSTPLDQYTIDHNYFFRVQ